MNTTLHHKTITEVFEMTSITKAGLGPDKTTFVVMRYKNIIAVVSPDVFYELENGYKEPLVVYCSREDDEVIPFMDTVYKHEIGCMAIDKYRFDTMVDLRKLKLHFHGIDEKYIDEINEFRSLFATEISNFK